MFEEVLDRVIAYDDPALASDGTSARGGHIRGRGEQARNGCSFPKPSNAPPPKIYTANATQSLIPSDLSRQVTSRKRRILSDTMCAYGLACNRFKRLYCFNAPHFVGMPAQTRKPTASDFVGEMQ